MRLDSYLVEIGMFETRTKAKQAIERGEIFLDDKAVTKCSYDVKLDYDLKIDRRYESSYVSVGGFKLEKALKDFKFDVKGMTVADIGCSTGGFTDCLLKNGAKKVYSVDLRDDLLHESLKSNPKVDCIIKNAKYLSSEDFCEPLDLIVADLSFISLNSVIKVFSSLIEKGKHLIILIKPQFETGKKVKFKNGIIKNKKIHLEVCRNVYDISVANGLSPQSITVAPIVEGKNTEFLILLEKGGKASGADKFFDKL